MIYHRLIHWTTLSLLSATAMAQTQSITGTVVDDKAKYPLIGATVILVGSDPLLGTTTDTEGKFTLEGAPVGRVSIAVQYVGYKDIVIPNVLLTVGKEAVLNVEMKELVQKLEGVTVDATRERDQPLNTLAKVSARTFSLEEVTRFAGGRNDVARLATSFAGVSAPSDARNDIVVRGNSPTGLLWRVEGIPIASTNHFATLGATGGPVNALNTNMLRTSDFLTGAFPAEYGNTNSAVFDILFRDGSKDKYEFTGQVAFTGVELMGEGPIKRKNNSSFVASYRYGLAPVVATGTTAIPIFQDFSFKVDLGRSKWGQFEVFGLGGLSSIDFLGDEIDDNDLFTDPDQDAYVKNQLGLVGVNNTYTLNKTTYIKTVVGASTNYNEYLQDNIIRNAQEEQIAKYRAINVHNRENRYTLSFTLNKKFNAQWSLVAGALSEFYDVRFKTDSKDDVDIPDSDGDGEPDYFRQILNTTGGYNLSQLYGQAEYQLNDKLNFTFGLHSQYHSLTQKWIAEPRAAASWQARQNQRLSAAYGMHAQSIPSPVLLYKEEVAPQRYQNTNEKLDFMKSHHVVISYEALPFVDWKIKVELYYQHLFDIPIERTPSSYSLVNEGADFAFDTRGSLANKGTGSNYGMELTAEKFFSKGYYALLTASLYQSTYKGSDGIERSSAFNNNVVGNLIGGKEWPFGKNKQNAIMLDTKLAASGGRPQTPIDLEKTRATGGREEVYIEEKAYSEHTSVYVRWDVKVGVRANIKKTSHEWFVEAQNVLDRKNELRYSYNKRRDAVLAVNQTGIFPVFLYRIRF